MTTPDMTTIDRWEAAARKFAEPGECVCGHAPLTHGRRLVSRPGARYPCRNCSCAAWKAW